ncbi:MAG: diaminopimelate decarboxylase [Phycisphaerae bacterium]|nr:diaminopimelate decarboxylase [Phycisphaerae bacterium]
MDHHHYRDGVLFCEDVSADTLAERFDTPLYVYSRATLTEHYQRMRQAFEPLDPLMCYSIKSCQNTHICRLLHELGSGFDVVSGGELHRALHVGASPARIVFAGVGKTDREINAGLDAGIGLFNIESESELDVIAGLAQARGTVASAALRVNPDVDPKTHQYTTTGKKETKFGVDLERAVAFFKHAAKLDSVNLRGIHLHIGSPIRDAGALADAIAKSLVLIDQLAADGLVVDTLDIGGGYGAYYGEDNGPTPADYAAPIIPLLKDRKLRVILEPGRSIAANAGILLTRVLHVKQSGERHFVIVDASMNELIRPALYDAYHFVWPVNAGEFTPPTRQMHQEFAGLQCCDVVGPVCESSDFLAKGRDLPPVKRGDLLAVFGAGAYAMTMASQYNSRPRPAEVLVEGQTPRVIRRRETYADLLAPEQIDPA